MAAAVSATHLRHTRPAFGLTVVPAAGSVLASPVPALWDPEPDYFYHWVRDAGVVMLSAVPLSADPAWRRRLADYVRFSLAIATRPGPAHNPLAETTSADHRRFLRPDAELAALHGDALLGEPRANADGSVDVERWSRPQFDGPALRALSVLAAMEVFAHAPGPVEAAERLLRLDLGHVLAHAGEPAIGPWEEEPAALDAFTLLAQRAALAAAGERLGDIGPALRRIDRALDALWCGDHFKASSNAEPGESDAATILGALLGAADAPFGVGDERMAGTARHIARWSRAAYPLAADLPLVGRFPGDVYFGGNPWLPTSLGFAEFHFRRARLLGYEAELVAGTRYLEAVRRALPQPGALPEQLDRTTGAPTSCRDLTWSHAALLAAAQARRDALSSSGRGAGS
nr:glycoside hydrolase family 15 protein [Acuticoccus mangrovi]